VDQEEEEKTTQKKTKKKTRKAQYPGFTHAAYRKQWLVRRKLGRRKNKEKEQIPHAQRAKTHDAIVNATLAFCGCQCIKPANKTKENAMILSVP